MSFSIAFWDALLERYLAPVTASLGDEYDAVRAEGRALAFDDAVELALRDDARPATAESARPETRSVHPPRWGANVKMLMAMLGRNRALQKNTREQLADLSAQVGERTHDGRIG